MGFREDVLCYLLHACAHLVPKHYDAQPELLFSMQKILEKILAIDLDEEVICSFPVCCYQTLSHSKYIFFNQAKGHNV